MAKVKAIIRENDVTFMSDPDIDFISLVGHAANQQPFKIMKGQVKGDENMNKVIHSILVPKDIDEDKLKELEDSYSFEEKDEESLEGFNVYKQVADEEVDLESKNLAVVDKDAGIYGIVAEKKEESKAETVDKESMDWATIDGIVDAMFSMEDIVLGVLRQPEAETGQRKDMVSNAIENFTKHVEAILSQAKSEDVIDLESIELKGENVKELRTQKQPEKDEPEVDIEEKLEALKTTIFDKLEEKAEEKSQAKIDEFKEEYDKMKKELNDNLNAEIEKLASKEDLETEIKSVKDEIEAVKNTPKSRKSEIDEHASEPEKKKFVNKNRNFITFV